MVKPVKRISFVELFRFTEQVGFAGLTLLKWQSVGFAGLTLLKWQ
jgi:hypothetical protein